MTAWKLVINWPVDLHTKRHVGRTVNIGRASVLNL